MDQTFIQLEWSTNSPPNTWWLLIWHHWIVWGQYTCQLLWGQNKSIDLKLIFMKTSLDMFICFNPGVTYCLPDAEFSELQQADLQTLLQRLVLQLQGSGVGGDVLHWGCGAVRTCKKTTQNQALPASEPDLKWLKNHFTVYIFYYILYSVYKVLLSVQPVLHNWCANIYSHTPYNTVIKYNTEATEVLSRLHHMLSHKLTFALLWRDVFKCTTLWICIKYYS